MTRARILSLSAGLGFAASAVAAPSISFNNAQFLDNGAGFGNVLNVLALHATGSESGSVLRSGGLDVLAGDATPQSKTVSVAELTTAGVNARNFGLVFNINEPPGGGPSVTLSEFSLVFYDSNDNVLFTSIFHPITPLVLNAVGPGTGTAGWLFSVSFTDLEATQFFANAGNRIGMILPAGNPILDSGGGPDNFYIVPAPSVLALSGMGLFAIARNRRRV